MNNLNDKIFALLHEAGLNWEVVKEPLVSGVDGAETDTFGIFKKTERIHLGTVGSRYEPYQNYQLAEAIVMASDSLNLEVSRGGELNGGKKVYLQAELPDVYVGKSNMKRWLTGLGSHDGTTSTGFGSSNQVVICANTWYRSYGEVSKFRHTASAAERIKAMAMDMNAALKKDTQLVNTFLQMADTPLKDDLVERVIRKIFSVDPKTTKQEDISTQKKNKIKSFADSLETEINTHGSNVWSMFQAVTRFVNHVIAPKEPNAKLSYLMTGTGYELSTLTFDLLAKEIGIETELILN